MHRFDVPAVDARFAVPAQVAGMPVVRVDSGVEAGSVVGPHYDPMLAKLICWAPTRRQAAARLAAAVRGTRVHGVRTNRDLLARVLADHAFLSGRTDTSFLRRDDLRTPLASPDAVRVSALAAALALAEQRRAGSAVLAGVPTGWRNVPSALHRASFEHAGERVDIGYRTGRAGLEAEGLAAEGLAAEVHLVSAAPSRVRLELAGVCQAFQVAGYPGLVCVDSPLGSVELAPVERLPEPFALAAAGSLLAPMPGTVLRIGPVVGERVSAGQPVLWLESMKMEHEVVAPVAGVVTALPVPVGAQVEPGTVLAVVSDAPDHVNESS